MNDSTKLGALPELIAGSESNWDAILAETLRLMGCETGTLHRFDEESGLLKLVACANIPEFLMPKIESIPVGKGIAGAAAERREAVQMCNLQTDTSGTARPDAKRTEVSGSLAVPILIDGKLLGSLGVGMRDPHEFTEEETARLWEISRMVGGAL